MLTTRVGNETRKRNKRAKATISRSVKDTVFGMLEGCHPSHPTHHFTKMKPRLFAIALLSMATLAGGSVCAEGLEDIQRAVEFAKTSGRPIFGHAGTKT